MCRGAECSVGNAVTQLPLPKAHKFFSEIVARWNRSKGRIDDMTCYLDGMNFPLTSIHGHRDYHNDECFQLIKDADTDS